MGQHMVFCDMDQSILCMIWVSIYVIATSGNGRVSNIQSFCFLGGVGVGAGGCEYSGTAVYDLFFFSSFWRAISCGR